MSILSPNEVTVKSDRAQWNAHKKEAIKVANRLLALGLKQRSQNIRNCGNYIVEHRCPSCGRSHGTTAMLCRDRVCPICSWRLSRRRFAEMKQVTEILRPTLVALGARASLLTLTLRNCSADDLPETLSSMSAAWHLVSKQTIMRRVIGWARSLEITYNHRTKTFHPHFHILLLWNGEADVTGQFNKRICRAWADCLHVDYNPVIDHREAYVKEVVSETDEVRVGINDDDLTPILLECTKYSMKSTDLPLMGDEDLQKYLSAIKAVRFVSYGKEIKKARQALGYADEPSNDDIDLYSAPDECLCGSEMERVLLKWSGVTGTYEKAPQVIADAWREAGRL